MRPRWGRGMSISLDCVSVSTTNFQLFKLCTQLGGHTHNKSAVCRLRLTANRLSIPVAKRHVKKEQEKSHTKTSVGPKHEGVIKIKQCNMQTIFKENSSYLFLVLELLTGRFLAMLAGFCYIHPWSRQRITPEENHRKKKKKKAEGDPDGYSLPIRACVRLEPSSGHRWSMARRVISQDCRCSESLWVS